MDRVNEILNSPLFSVGGTDYNLGRLLVVLLVIGVGYLAIRLLRSLIVRRMTHAGQNPDLVHLVGRVVFILALLVLAFTALQLLEIPLAAFAFVSGAVAIGVGFGAQNIINNFISGWILMAERPIRIDDFIELGEHRGTVEAINTRSTRIRRVDGVHMLVPNSQLLEQTVINWTLIDRDIRAVVRVGVAYGSPVELVRELITQAVTNHAHVQPEPKPLVIFEDFGDSALVFDAYFWVQTGGERDLRVVRSEIRFAIDRLFREHDIVIAFPQRDVHLDATGPINVHLTREQAT
jgi:small-conductance mechanosensitive channel